jgi:hypothetical protein
MVMLYPVLLVVAGVVVLLRLAIAAPDPRARWHWFLAWCATGAVFSFSYVTGLSIGLLVLPFAVVLLLLAAWFAPGPGEAVLGFVAGIGLVLLLIGFIQRDGEWVNPAPYLLGGILACMLAVGGYTILREERS